jgi:hypothetical protein
MEIGVPVIVKITGTVINENSAKQSQMAKIRMKMEQQDERKFLEEINFFN